MGMITIIYQGLLNLNSINKIEVLISFPLGAKFHQNPILYTYKQFLKMLHRLNCVASDCKCNTCTLQKECNYYFLTGDNFNKYPGIFINNDLFIKTIYKENDELLLTFYMIGKCSIYKEYISVFVEEYLNHKLATHFFQVKYIRNERLSFDEQSNQNIHVKTLVEDEQLFNVYNAMICFYNQAYEMNLSTINGSERYNVKKQQYPVINLNTKKVNMKGVVYQSTSEEPIPMLWQNIGIGKYNYLGGGKIAFENKIESK